MSNADDVTLTFRRFNHSKAASMRATVEDIYVSSYVEAIASGDPFDSVNAFMSRFDSYVQREGFDLVIAYKGLNPVGQAWGWPLGPGSGWWACLLEVPDPEFTVEDGSRTFALSEIMVKQRFSGRHYARRLHDSLLSGRGERRATLLVEAENVKAYRAYVKWGWQQVAQLLPNWPDAPLFDVFMHELPLSTASAVAVT